MGPNLITFSDLRNYCEVSTQVLPQKYETYMWQAETIDLVACIGPEMYYDWVNNIHAAHYMKLLAGDNYTPSGASGPIMYHGARPVISYYAYARYLKAQNIESTAFGMVTKTNEYSNPVSDRTIARKITEAIELARAYEREMIAYLNNHIHVYDYWKARCCARKGGSVVITAVGGSIYQ